jgi:signal transduction histidine kinase
VTSNAEILRGLPYFSEIPDELLDNVCASSVQMDVEPDTTIITEGSESEDIYVVIDGELLVTKQSGGKEVVLARVGPKEVVGEMALLDQAPRNATVKTSHRSRLMRVPADAFEVLLQDPRVVRRMFRTVTSRLRSIENTLRHEERMAALGRMAAQLMHELNNPAAAVSRSTQELTRVQENLGEAAQGLAKAIFTEGILDLPSQAPELSALERSDRENEVADWLEENGVENPWDLAPGLVEAGWDTEYLGRATASLPEDLVVDFLRWIGLRATASQVVDDLRIAAGRISELVRVVKEFSFLDQGSTQQVDVSVGIRDTLVLMKHKLRNIEVEVSFAEDLAPVEASGRDLNQVWTNLIDNAADAMDGEGTLEISAVNSDGNVVVTVADSGPGVSPDVLDRIFDPFFTTKEPGKGTGLGLPTVHTIVRRIGGRVDVDSAGSGTLFTVTLPAISEE